MTEGVNSTVTMQVPPAGIEAEHVFVAEKSLPITWMLETGNAVVRLFVITMFCGVLVVLTFWGRNSSAPGVNEKSGKLFQPVPERVTV